MDITRTFLSMFVALTLFLGCSSEEDSAEGYDFTAFETAMEAFVAEKAAIEGAGAIIVHKDDGVIYRSAFGTFDEDRDYLIASSSKR